MEDQQQYRMDFSVPENLGSKTKCFLKFTQNEAIVNEEILTNCQQTFYHTYFFIYNSPLGPPSNN